MQVMPGHVLGHEVLSFIDRLLNNTFYVYLYPKTVLIVIAGGSSSIIIPLRLTQLRVGICAEADGCIINTTGTRLSTLFILCDEFSNP